MLDEKLLKEMSENERKVAEIIYRHNRENPIQGHDIITISGLGIDIRDVRQIVRDLILVFNLPIGSRTRSPAGYYWIDDPSEMDDAYQRLWKRGWAILRRAYRMKVISRRMQKGQVAIKLEGDQWPKRPPRKKPN